MVNIKRSEIIRMQNNVLCYAPDEITQFDLFEWEHPDKEWNIIEDVKELDYA